MPKSALNTPLPRLTETGIYLHIPYCKSKCRYCSFNSHAGREDEIAAYIAALLLHIKNTADLPWCQGRIFSTLYLGGGTPTICESKALSSLIHSCLSLFPFAPNPEITVETNPNTLSFDKLVALRQSGVNRLSIGVQSFAADELKMLGRSHTSGDAIEAFTLARRAGFDNISLDLMFGLPGQTAKIWRDTLETALRLSPDHFSLYELMVETGTPLAAMIERKELILPPENEVVEMTIVTDALLAAAGFKRYEISNYAKTGFPCRHNMNYWENESWLGLGAGAVASFSGMKISNVSDPALYIQRINSGRSPYSDIECLSREALFRETVIMGLRMIRGVSINNLKKRFDFHPRAYYGKEMDRLLEKDMLVVEGDYLRLTDRALPVANQALSQLV